MKLRACLSLFIITLLFFANAGISFAHSQSMGYSAVYVKGNVIDYELFLDQRDMLGQFDTNKDNNLENEELASQKERIESLLQKDLRIDVDSKPLKMELLSMNMAEKGSTRGAVLQLKLTADEAIEQFNLHYNLVFEDAPVHTSVLLVHSGEFFYQDILDINKKDVQIAIAQPEIGSVLWEYFVLGIEHILTGYDHLLFLLSLVLIASSFKDALKIVTAFTIAHSITLFLVASGRIQVIPSWVEALIALTICYVAVENMFVQKAKWRWLLTAIFGLIHGMGFAGALAETGLPKDNLIGTLLMFNLGVETGQLMVLCLLLPFLLWLRRFPWYRKMMISTSCLIFVLAFYWLLQRLQ
ncbi:HupE/UreJ family protein [Paenibacillus terrigena]|uniref:HupE/UreJ family protein n=1 Tax=Paenibacillus terrigena TaxID=369333 RepID=UPI0028D56E7B|nr:HupE/UreJ family protein [Paenibacillus terrigena]